MFCFYLDDWDSSAKSKKTPSSSAKKKSSGKKTTPKSARKEKLPGKTPRKPLPSHKPIKRKSSSASSAAGHLPSVSGLQNGCLCSMSPCKSSSCNKGCSGQCKGSKHLSPSPPHFCCTSQDRLAHSHNSIPPHLSPKPMTVKTTSRMSMRGPANKKHAAQFKLPVVVVNNQSSSVGKTGGGNPPVLHHHHSLSGMHLCARHRHQIQHQSASSHLTWSSGSTSSHNSSSASSSSGSHNSSNSSDDTELEMPQISPSLLSPSISNIVGDKEVVVKLKQLPDIVVASALSGSKPNLDANAKYDLPHTCSKRKLEEPSAPRKRFKIAKPPPQKKFENKSPLPRKTMTPTSAQATPSAARKVNLSTPTKKKQFSNPSPSKVSSPKSKLQGVASPSRSPARPTGKDVSPKKSDVTDVPPVKLNVKEFSLRKDNAKEMSPRKAERRDESPRKESVRVKEKMLKDSSSSNSSSSSLKTKPARSLKRHTCKSLSSAKQSTLEMFLQPMRKSLKSHRCPGEQDSLESHRSTAEQDSNTPVPRKRTKVKDAQRITTLSGRSLLSIKSLCRMSTEKGQKAPEVAPLSTPKESSDQQKESTEDQVLSECLEENEAKEISHDEKKPSPTVEKPVSKRNAALKNLLDNGESKANSSSPSQVNKLSRKGKSWNAHMASGKLVFSKSPPADVGASGSKGKEKNSTWFICKTPSTEFDATSTPIKFISMPEGRGTTRSSPRLIKERKDKLKVTKRAAAKLKVLPIPLKGTDGGTDVWVPGIVYDYIDDEYPITSLTSPAVEQSNKSCQANLSNVDQKIRVLNCVEKSPSKPPPRNQSSPGKKPRLQVPRNQSSPGKKPRVRILYLDEALSDPSKEKKHVRRSLSKTTAMSQEQCFFEVLEFNKTMLAATASTSSVTKTLEQSSPVNKRREVINNIDDDDEIEFTLNRHLVRRSSRLVIGTPTKGGMFVRRSPRDKSKNRLRCDSCKAKKKACFCTPTKEQVRHQNSPLSKKPVMCERNAVSRRFLPLVPKQRSKDKKKEMCQTVTVTSEHEAEQPVDSTENESISKSLLPQLKSSGPKPEAHTSGYDVINEAVKDKNVDCGEQRSHNYGQADKEGGVLISEGKAKDVVDRKDSESSTHVAEDNKEEVATGRQGNREVQDQRSSAKPSMESLESTMNNNTGMAKPEAQQEEMASVESVNENEVVLAAEMRRSPLKHTCKSHAKSTESKEVSMPLLTRDGDKMAGDRLLEQTSDQASMPVCDEITDQKEDNTVFSHQPATKSVLTDEGLPPANLDESSKISKQSNITMADEQPHSHSDQSPDTDTAEPSQQQEIEDDQSTEKLAKEKGLSPWACQKNHKHQPSCRRKHVHFPVCNQPHLHGPQPRKGRGSPLKRQAHVPIHVHKPRCLAPHLHGPQTESNRSPDCKGVCCRDFNSRINGRKANGEEEDMQGMEIGEIPTTEMESNPVT